MKKEAGKMKIGVLALQGGFQEHIHHINELGYDGVLVKTVEDLKNIKALIIPGGESTTMGKLLKVTGLLSPLKEMIKNGLPVWGTCAGMILLAKNIDGETVTHLGVMDISVRRNAYGTQLDSFSTQIKLDEVDSNPLDLVFIRAPYVSEVKNSVNVLAKVNNNIVAVRENNMLVTSFHPELTSNTSFHKYFLKTIAGL